MPDGFRKIVFSSLGKKALMALSGLGLIGFLIVHLAGNLLIYKGQHGEAFDAYAHTLDSNPALPLAEIGLLALFVAHIALAFRVSTENRDARAIPYRVRASKGAKTIASSTMLVTGAIVLIFLVVHVYDFRIKKMFEAQAGQSLAGMVEHRLSSAIGVIVYLIGVTALGFHLRHGFRSAFQTLGVSHPRWNDALVKLSWIIAIALSLGFASFPLFFLWKASAT